MINFCQFKGATTSKQDFLEKTFWPNYIYIQLHNLSITKCCNPFMDDYHFNNIIIYIYITIFEKKNLQFFKK